VIISDKLSKDETQSLVATLKKYRSVIGYSLKDLKGISLSLFTHRIPMEQDHKPVREHQRRLNNAMREVVKKEVLKLLKVVVIYLVSDCEWVRPVQVVPKKGEMTVICNEKMNSFLSRLSPVGGCVSTTGSSTKPPGKFISRYPSLMKC
jgi:undecaprenyl pyrophosphate synthase